MRIERNKSLKPFNTFGIEASARRFVSVRTEEELRQVLLRNRDEDILVLGGGSNLLLTGDLDQLVIHIALKGIQVRELGEQAVEIEAMAGENWHELVLFCLERNYGGIENLALIPGNCGTAPVQNIGAYGVELKDSFVRCRAMEIGSGEVKSFSKEDCRFGYRQSIFKNALKGRYIILSITLELSRTAHRINTSYGAIASVLEEKGISNPGIREVAEAVIQIRRSKLPDPREIGNSGSFFKNPVLKKATFDNFISKYPEAPFYPLPDDHYKVPAGWLIEQAGFKGKRFGDAGVHEKQALVLVNHGHASGKEIAALAMRVKQTVLDRFGIELEPEVTII